MSYSVLMLTTVSDCDALLVVATTARGDLDHKRYTLQRKQLTATATAAEIESDIAATESEIGIYDTVLPTLPEGTIKEQIADKRVRAAYKLYTLNEKKKTNGVLSVLLQERDVACLDLDVVENDAFIAAIEARKAAL